MFMIRYKEHTQIGIVCGGIVIGRFWLHREKHKELLGLSDEQLDNYIDELLEIEHITLL